MSKFKLSSLLWPKNNTYSITDFIVIIFYSLLMILVFLADTTLVEKIITFWGLLVIIRQTDSRIVFLIALVGLINVLLLSVLNQEKLVESFAVYIFYFLVIGVIAIMLEDQDSRIPKIDPKAFKPIAKINYQSKSTSLNKSAEKIKPSTKRTIL